jgi:peptidoglycan/LPS O-acetylase OafA/YrhL
VLLLLARSRRIVLWLGLLLAGFLLYRYALLWRGVPLRRVYYSPDLHSEGLVAGALLAAVRIRRPRFAVGEAIAQASVPVALICVLGLGTGDVIWAFGLPVFELAAVGMVAAALSATAFASFFATRPLVWLGQRSYSLYLWHMPILWTVGHRERLLGLALSFLAASLSYRYVEQPFRRRSVVATRTAMLDPPPRIQATAAALADVLD